PPALVPAPTGAAATGSIEVLSQPAGASVYIDDEPVGWTDRRSGRLVKSGLSPGRHRVRVASTGHEDAAGEVNVVPGTGTTFPGGPRPRLAGPRPCPHRPHRVCAGVDRRGRRVRVDRAPAARATVDQPRFDAEPGGAGPDAPRPAESGRLARRARAG